MTAQVIDFKTRKVLQGPDASDYLLEQRLAHIDRYIDLVAQVLVGIEEATPGQYLTHLPIVILPHAGGRVSMTIAPKGLQREMVQTALDYSAANRVEDVRALNDPEQPDSEYPE